MLNLESVSFAMTAEQLILVQAISSIVTVVATMLLVKVTADYARDTKALVSRQDKLIAIETEPVLRVTREPNEIPTGPDLAPTVEISNLGRGHAVDITMEVTFYAGSQDANPIKQKLNKTLSWTGAGTRNIPLIPDGSIVRAADCQEIEVTLFKDAGTSSASVVYQSPRMRIYPPTRQSLAGVDK